MPAKKSSPDSKKNSPKSKKSSPTKKNQGKEVKEEVIEEWKVARPETPPERAPRGPGAMYVKRQPWYPHVNNGDLEWSEYSWSPLCPLVTSWGDVWVSDRARRRIWRYRLEGCLGGWWERRGNVKEEVEVRKPPAGGKDIVKEENDANNDKSAKKSSPKRKETGRGSPKSKERKKGSPVTKVSLEKKEETVEAALKPPTANMDNLKTIVGGLQRLPSLLVRGEPSIIVETPGTGRILVLIHCPFLRKTTLTQLSPNGDVENTRDYLYERSESVVEMSPGSTDVKVKTSPKSESKKGSPGKSESKKGSPGKKEVKRKTPPNKPQQTEYSDIFIDEGRPIGIAVDKDLIYVLRSPLQRMELLHYRKLHPIDFRLQSRSKIEGCCIHLAPSGGCVAGNGLLYVAACRPPRIVVFEIIKDMCFTVIDRVTLRALCEFGMDRLKQPCCLALDSLGVLAVSDSQWGFLRAYHKLGLETSAFGGWKVDTLRVVRPGHFSISKNGITCLVDLHLNRLLLYVDKVIFKWYRDTLFYMEELAWLKHIVDKELPPYPTIRRPEPTGIRKGFDIVRWPLDDPDGIWPRPPKKAIVEQEKEMKESPGKKNKKAKKSPPSKSKTSSKKNKK